jgi:zinc transporter ZupT
MDTSERVGIAFAYTIGAGLCTVLGSLLIFCMNVVNFSSLAKVLAFAAGTVVYVSLVDFNCSHALSN